MPAIDRSKYLRVASTLRARIMAGVYQLGSRLPARTDMAIEFEVSNATIQRVFDALAADGFVTSRPSGTFVAGHPPHLCRYGIAMSGRLQWSRMYEAVSRAAGMVRDERTRFAEYFVSSEVAHREDTDRLGEDVLRHRVGGLILSGASILKDLAGTPALSQAGLPRVRGDVVPESDIPSVYLDTFGSFIVRAADYLTGLGCRRIAHLRLVGEVSQRELVEATLRRTGIELRPYWMQSVYAGTMHETTPNLVMMMMRLEGPDRPDAIIIHDDNMIEHVVAGLMASGVKVPDDLKIVAHFNYPASAASALPMKRLGFDCRMWLRKCVEVLEMQRRGEPASRMNPIPAVFAEELDPDGSAPHA